MEDDGASAYSGVREHDYDNMVDRVDKKASLASEDAITTHTDNKEKGAKLLRTQIRSFQLFLMAYCDESNL